MFTHDIIKIQYVNIGYLPNIPYHMISDKEMFEAFLKEDGGFFSDYYPCPSDELASAYTALLECITQRITEHMEDPTVEIPNWVYSYMLLAPITYESPEADISYLYDLLNMTSDNSLEQFTPEIAEGCYKASVDWLRKQPAGTVDRPPTMFGEPHVIKNLRLTQANVLIDNEDES